jgi:Tfp pilus assembly protein PilV
LTGLFIAGAALALIRRMANTRYRRRSAGFAVVEVLIASTLLTVVLLAAAHLLAAATAANLSAERMTAATVLAVDKMEQLRALPIGDPALALSPPDALAVSVDGQSDRLDAGFVRRWSVQALSSYPDDAVVVQVVVVDERSTRRVRLETIRTRKPAGRTE